MGPTPESVTFRADWVLPITDPPLRDGWVTVENGRVTALGAGSEQGAIDLGRAAVLPALVNAHTHLELSYLHGRVPPGDDFCRWIRTLMALRRQYPDPADPDIIAAARRSIASARESGTGLIGDISNTLVTVPLLREARMAARVFYELLGFSIPDAGERVRAAVKTIAAAGAHDDVRVTLAPHAPYSVSPALFKAIRAELDTQSAPVTSVHLGESAAEIELLRHGRGALRALLEELGVWNDEWQPPRASPVMYLSNLGFLDRCVVAVHGVQFEGADLSRLAALGATIVSCPRSNRHVGVGDPPLEAFFAMDVEVALGTDSLASVADLNVFSELKEARRLAPRVPARALLRAATLAGARALGFEEDLGSIEAGKRAALIAVTLPDDVADVEEYLLSGIEPAAVRWLEMPTPDVQFPT
jgi:cytosine/adenosine deaminase-related metal-dependent hydrolase